MLDAATPLREHTNIVNSVSFSPGGILIVSGSSHTTVRRWDAATGRPVGSHLQGHAGAINSLLFSPDEIRIVSGSHDKTIRVWDAVTGKLVVSPSRGILVGLGQFRSRHLARWGLHCIWFGGQHCQVLACSKLAAIAGVYQARIFNCLPGSKSNHASDEGPHCRINQHSGPSLHLLLIQLNGCIAQQR